MSRTAGEAELSEKSACTPSCAALAGEGGGCLSSRRRMRGLLTSCGKQWKVGFLLKIF